MKSFINEWVHFSECSMPITLKSPKDSAPQAASVGAAATPNG